MKRFLAVLLVIPFSLAHARPIELSVTDYGWATSFPPIRDVIDFYLQGVENDLNQEQPILNPARLNYGTANSSVLASKGLGTDYVLNPEKFQLSLGVGVAYDNEKNVAIRNEISGAAAASSLTLGARMDRITDKPTLLGLETNRLMGYLNFGTFNYSRVVPGEDIDIAGDIRATNLGIHLRYDLVERKQEGFWGWGGLKLHTGYEYNVNKVELKTNIDRELEVDSGGAGILEGRLLANPTYDIDTRTHSIPLELSSSVYFLWFISLYGGVGVDLNFGKSKSVGETNGDVSSLACTSGVCVGETVLPQVEVQANYDAKSQVRSPTYRVFAGLQLELPLDFHAYAQAEQMLGTKVIGVSSGLKFEF